jgi:2-succinyl-6-hydroxy-2,4-cyclohexadiene-1-carboxylate synthase
MRDRTKGDGETGEGFEREFYLNGIGHVYECGKPEKPLVVLLHGFMQGGRSWQQIAPLLKTHHVLAPDLLGHGKTVFEAGKTLDLDAYIEQLNSLIEWARTSNSSGKTDKVSLVGYSMGGRIAALYATRYPEKISSLVLESAGLGPRTEEERIKRTEKSASMVARLERSCAADPAAPLADFVEFWESLPLFETQSDLDEQVRKCLREERLANDPQALRCNLEQAGQHRMDDLRPALVALNKPVLYLVGERDVAYTEIARSLMRAWAERNTCSNPFEQGFVQVSVIPRTGHNIHLEAPEEYARIVDMFLSRSL